MKNPEILVVCKHPDILATILRLIHKKDGWKATGAASVEDAKDLCNKTSVNIVLIGAGIEEEEEQALQSSLAARQPGLRFVRHYGGGSGLLFGEIIQALS